MDYVKYLREYLGTRAINLTGVCVIIVNENNQILLQKRGTYPYKWGLVGGITELGESLEETAIRETYEETGLILNELSLFKTVSGAHCLVNYPNGDKVYYITVCYTSKSYSGNLICDNKESLELKYFGKNNLPRQYT